MRTGKMELNKEDLAMLSEEQLYDRIECLEGWQKISQRQKTNLWQNIHKKDAKINSLQKRVKILEAVVRPAYQYLEEGGCIECGSKSHGEFEQALKGV